MQGRSGNNNGYLFCDGTFKGYPKFRRRWHTFQSIYPNLTPQKELGHQFWDNCMDKKVTDKILREESMAECQRLLDSFYCCPAQFTQDLLAEIIAFRKIQYSDYKRLFEYYVLL
jgi:hypothetical protein